MQFVIGYAGIPPEVYDGVHDRKNWICGDNASFISCPLRLNVGTTGYTDSHANFFLREFCNLFTADHENRLKDTGFALIYVDDPHPSTKTFIKKFFPSLLCFPIQWTLDKSRQLTIRQSKNRLLNLLKVTTDHAKSAIPIVKKEVTERDNRTPLLLPVKNFHSRVLVPALEQLQSELLHSKDRRSTIKCIVQELERSHPRQNDGPEAIKSSFLVDDRRIEFRSPGKNRHGIARGGVGHQFACLLSGRRRLGAPYDHAFHYDCTKEKEALKDLFFGCHEAASIREGNPHLNIAPNDFVRP